MLPSTQRFSNRVENYVKYRPTYPPQIIEALRTECGLKPEHLVADVGSGTGILTALLLDAGNTVAAIEPNAEMRLAAEGALQNRAGFRSVSGTAEATTFPDYSVDFVVAAQAFHWFEPTATRREFRRILRPGGWVALVWNRRPATGSPVQNAYDALLRRYAPEYAQVSHERVDEDALMQFFAPANFSTRHFTNSQQLDSEAFRGRLLSSSYTPLPGQAGHDELMVGVDEVFATYSEDGLVRFDYDTQLVFGHLEAA